MSDSPYESPKASTTDFPPDRRSGGIFFPLLGLILYTAPIWAWISAKLRIRKTLEMVADQQDISAAMAQLVQQLKLIWVSGIAVGIIGAICILVSILKHRNRQVWFFWSALIVSVVLCCLYVVVGMIIALPVAAIFLFRTREFFGAKKIQP